jgi:hypothetical protein
VPVCIVEWSVNDADDCLAGVVQTELQAETKQGSMYVYELNEAPAEVRGCSSARVLRPSRVGLFFGGSRESFTKCIVSSAARTGMQYELP